MAKKMGRPRVAKKDAFSKYFSVRLKPDEEREVREAIRKSGQPKSDWLRSALLKVARNGYKDRLEGNLFRWQTRVRPHAT